MLWLTLKVICLISIGVLIALEVEDFKLQYIAGYPAKELLGSAVIIIWLVANVVILIMWR